MAQITRDTKISDIKVGDTLLNGEEITSVEITKSGRYKIAPLYYNAVKDATVKSHSQLYGLTEQESNGYMEAFYKRRGVK